MTLPRPYYADGAVTLYHGDARELLPELGAVDAVITDPPYSEHVHSKARAGTQKLHDSDVYSRAVDFGFAAITEELRAFVSREFARLVGRWALVFSDVESCHLWRDALVAYGLQYVRTGAWVRLGGTPQFSGDRPAPGFESITITHPRGRKRWNGGGSAALWSYHVMQPAYERTKRLHPTEKPLKLMIRLVSLFTDPGELILDPFAGSGTTLRAAKDLGRRAIGIELEERFCEAAAKRLAQETLPLGAA